MTKTITETISSNSPSASTVSRQAVGGMTEEKIVDILGALRAQPFKELGKGFVFFLIVAALAVTFAVVGDRNHNFWFYIPFFVCAFILIIGGFAYICMVCRAVWNYKANSFLIRQLKDGKVCPDFYMSAKRIDNYFIIDKQSNAVYFNKEVFPFSDLYKIETEYNVVHQKKDDVIHHYIVLIFRNTDTPRRSLHVGVGEAGKNVMAQEYERLLQFLGWK